MRKRFLLIFMVLSMILPYAGVCAAEETNDEAEASTDNAYSSIDTTTYYYDRFDNDAYKNVYRQLIDPAESFYTSNNDAVYSESGGEYYYKAFTITVSKKNWEIIGSDGMQTVINAFIADNPKYFWMSSSFKYTAQSLEGGSVCYVVEIICYDDYANGSSRQVLANNIDITISNYAEALDDDLPEYQMEYLIHNNIINDIYYNVDSEASHSGDAWLYTVDGVFNSSHKSATSFGYAKAFKAVMDYLGIKCIYVEGNTTETENGNTYHAHAWNMVCLDDGWYVVDLANDDPETTSGKNVLIYDYFNITSDKATNLVPATDWLSGIPTCNGTAYSITNVELLLADTDSWQDDNYNFFDKILDTYGVSVVLISLGLILILLVALFRHAKARHKKRKQEKIKNTKTVAIDHSELDNELRNPPL